jgi:hypothetical protein
VKGGHWQRSFLNPRTPPDDIFKRDWLDGRTHPLTGKPLEIYRPAVAPGTMVSILHREHIDRHAQRCVVFFFSEPPDADAEAGAEAETEATCLSICWPA